MRNRSSLDFDQITPQAASELGGLHRDNFAHGRLFATVADHGGLLEINYFGKQRLEASRFFKADPGTGWTKLFRLSLKLDGKRYYPVLSDTSIYPFGLRSHCRTEDVVWSYDLLLLGDALVQRIKIHENPRDLKVGMEIIHQEAITAINRTGRTWEDFRFVPEENVFVTSCVDISTAPFSEESALAQEGLQLKCVEDPRSETWIGLGCNLPLVSRRGYHARSKYYLETAEHGIQQAAAFLAFATGEDALHQRLAGLSQTVFDECDALIAGYEARLLSRPQIHTGNKVLDSAFGQYPELIETLKVPDQPGAVRANFSSYFVWGWDGMMPLFACPLANDAGYSADILRFFHSRWHPEIGMPHQFSTSFAAQAKAPFPAQAQYLAGLYIYVAATGDTGLAREVWTTCLTILNHCRAREVAGSGLVSGCALWPDFPEAMEETGRDISSMNNSLFYQGLRCMEYLAAALGEVAVAHECRDWARRLRVSFRKYLFDEEKGFFISSCSADDFAPRRHYCPQAVFWLTPFARELVAHSARRVVDFLDKELRSPKCLLTLPHWDTAWMADGNQLGSSFPAADSFYLGAHKLVGDEAGLRWWLGDVEWFWNLLTAPEAFTPEAENEEILGPDNLGGKQLQAVTTWYAGAFYALAGIDFDHEGLTISACGGRPLRIEGWKIRGGTLDLEVSGAGPYLAELKLNGTPLPLGLQKISWSQLAGHARLEWVRTTEAPASPSILRADGLSVSLVASDAATLSAWVSGKTSGEVVVRASALAKVTLAGAPVGTHDANTGTLVIPVEAGDPVLLEVRE